jgi:hypothetical protein
MKIGQIRKLVVTAAAIWLILTSMEIPSVFAHTVLGTPDGDLSYFRKNDHESNPKNTIYAPYPGSAGHVPGPLAYVWPGSGSNTYLEDPSLPPGYQRVANIPQRQQYLLQPQIKMSLATSFLA